MHYLYACHFSNGHIKVGRSINPMARIASHEDRVSCLGVELVEHQIFECVGHVIQAEAELIRRCGEAAKKTNKNEWFEGLDFLEVCEWAEEVVKLKFEVHENAVQRLDAVQRLGGPAAVARMTGLKSPTVHGWKQIPAGHCPVIERALGGAVTVEEMRPDVQWHRVKDKSWPNPAGRPLIDVIANPRAA